MHNRVQRRAVDGVAGPERVERGRRRRAEAGAAVGDDDHVALVAEQLADGHRDQQAQQREVEEQVAEFAQIALLGGHLDGFGDRVFLMPDGRAPAAQPAGDGVGQAVQLLGPGRRAGRWRASAAGPGCAGRRPGWRAGCGRARSSAG